MGFTVMRYSKKYDDVLQDELLQGDECDYSGDGNSSEVRVGRCESAGRLRMCLRTCVCARARVRVYMCVRVRVCMCVRTCVCVCVCV